MRLELELRVHGEAKLNAVRDRARASAKKFGWTRELARLDAVIGAFLGTRTRTTRLATETGHARALGEPYDAEALERCTALVAMLRSAPISDVETLEGESEDVTNKAFFEAYFSNYIEGTRFGIEEAERIITDRSLHHVVPPMRTTFGEPSRSCRAAMKCVDYRPRSHT